MVKLHIKKGDRVKVIAGEFKGKEGRVLSVSPTEQRAKVEGLNLVKRHMKPTAQNTTGSIVEKEAPIHISNLMVIDTKGNPTRIKREVVDGKLARVSKKSGEVIK